MRALFAGLSLTLIAACATPTPYTPALDDRYGYSEQKIETDRYRVQFSGNAMTDRETVEQYLLYRAAELTREQGFDHFIIARRDVDETSRLIGSPVNAGNPSLFYPHYRYFHPRFGWYGAHDPFWNDVRLTEVSKYEATAEIVLGRGTKPSRPDAFQAADVIENLRPTLRLPEAG